MTILLGLLLVASIAVVIGATVYGIHLAACHIARVIEGDWR